MDEQTSIGTNEKETTDSPIPEGEYRKPGYTIVLDIEKEEKKMFFRKLNQQLRKLA